MIEEVAKSARSDCLRTDSIMNWVGVQDSGFQEIENRSILRCLKDPKAWYAYPIMPKLLFG